MAEPNKKPSGPPWLNPTIQSKIDWRDDDIVVSVPSKSGTTWTMNIVHQLRTKGDCNFDDIYHEVKWIEAMDTPESTVDDMVKNINDMDTTKPRTFKSHKSPSAVSSDNCDDDPASLDIVGFVSSGSCIPSENSDAYETSCCLSHIKAAVVKTDAHLVSIPRLDISIDLSEGSIESILSELWITCNDCRVLWFDTSCNYWTS